MKRRVTAVAFCSVFMASSLGTVQWAPHASAHAASLYYSYRWITEYEECMLIFFFCSIKTRDIENWTTGSGWTTALQDRIKDAQGQWNNVSTEDYFNFVFKGSASLNANPCNNPYNKNGHGWAYIDGASNEVDVLATTYLCVYDTGSALIMHSFMIRYDSGNTWYSGTDSPSESELDFQDTATHELGHATGWTGHFGEGTGECPAPNTNTSRHTMCTESGPEGSTWGRTLETHDKHTFQDWYGGVPA